MQSLENHLRDALENLKPILPIEQSRQLEDALKDHTQISYHLLRKISTWSQVNAPTLALHHLSPSSYTMTALLAGSITSPKAQFTPPVQRSLGPSLASVRKEVTAVLNCILTVLGSGGGAWYAAAHAGWGSEWRVLFAFLTGIIVAAVEILLYAFRFSKIEATITTKPYQDVSIHRRNPIKEQQESTIQPLSKTSISTVGGLRQRKLAAIPQNPSEDPLL